MLEKWKSEGIGERRKRQNFKNDQVNFTLEYSSPKRFLIAR